MDRINKFLYYLNQPVLTDEMSIEMKRQLETEYRFNRRDKLEVQDVLLIKSDFEVDYARYKKELDYIYKQNDTLIDELNDFKRRGFWSLIYLAFSSLF